ncbi:MAG: IniB N-terminal domain-containing protein [Pseudonocardia sp.]
MDALLAFILRLLNDDAALEDFNADPHAAVAAAGFSDLDCDDVDAVLPILFDSSVDVSQDRGYDTGATVVTGASGGNSFHGGGGGKYVSSHDAAVHQISTVVNNTTVYDNDTIYDSSINQNFIASDGGLLFVDQDIDQTNANGDGAVAVGGDNSGDINTGDGAVTGNGNNVVGGDGVAGDGNTIDQSSDDDTSLVIGDGNNVGDGNTTVVTNTDNSDNSSTDESVSESGPGDLVQGGQDNSQNAEDASQINSGDTDQTGLINIDDTNIPVLSGNDLDLDVDVPILSEVVGG